MVQLQMSGQACLLTPEEALVLANILDEAARKAGSR